MMHILATFMVACNCRVDCISFMINHLCDTTRLMQNVSINMDEPKAMIHNTQSDCLSARVGL